MCAAIHTRGVVHDDAAYHSTFHACRVRSKLTSVGGKNLVNPLTDDAWLQGVQVHIMDVQKAPLSDIQFLVMQEIAALYPDRAVFEHADKGRFRMFDMVSGSEEIRKRFSQRNRWEDVRDYWYKDAEDFRRLSKKYYLYK